MFILIGLQLPLIVHCLEGYSPGEALGYGLVVTGVIIMTRMAYALGTPAFTRLVGKVTRTNDRSPGRRELLVFGWAGIRGVVSLASALSVPLLRGGEAFPQRNLILFIVDGHSMKVQVAVFAVRFEPRPLEAQHGVVVRVGKLGRPQVVVA